MWIGSRAVVVNIVDAFEDVMAGKAYHNGLSTLNKL